VLLVDANADERRLISAVATRAGWSAIGAADEEITLAADDGVVSIPYGEIARSNLIPGV